ncbi:MAG: exosortase/archaeosortase family protein [bacterium]
MDDAENHSGPAGLTADGNRVALPLRWLLAPALALAAMYGPALIDLVSDWYQDANYSHGFLIGPVSAWLLWRRRGEFRNMTPKVDHRGLALVLAALGLFVVANAGAEYFTLRVSLVMLLAGLVWYLLGLSILKKAWFEVAVLLFMIPLPYVIYYSATFPLQLLASKITVTLLNLIGAGAVREGNIIHLSGISLAVAEACSGMRSLVSLMALGAVYAHISQLSAGRKLLLFLAGVPIAVGANVVRVFVTALLAYIGGAEVTAEPWHTLLGLSVFVMAFIGLSVTAVLLRGRSRV